MISVLKRCNLLLALENENEPSNISGVEGEPKERYLGRNLQVRELKPCLSIDSVSKSIFITVLDPGFKGIR